MVSRPTTVRGPRPRPEPEPEGLYIVVSQGLRSGDVIELEPGEWIIGKAEDAAVSLPDSGVSRRHAKIIRSRDGTVVLLDLESTNGTYVNDQRIETSPLREGARIGIGPDTELTFSMRRPAAAAPAPKPEISNPLTKREFEIAGLVAQGLTNPQIGARLGIKGRTVSSHLDNIYGRLRLSGRAALTRWLYESRLA